MGFQEPTIRYCMGVFCESPLFLSLADEDQTQAALETNGGMSVPEALALASTNLEHLLGVQSHDADSVATKSGSLLDFEGKVVGIISPVRGLVDLIV